MFGRPVAWLSIHWCSKICLTQGFYILALHFEVVVILVVGVHGVVVFVLFGLYFLHLCSVGCAQC